MLDNDTKRRIDAARDTLVGKVPDPKSQVEQITIALIYKFMADMDNQAESVGGKRSFFAGAFESYRWENLMSPGLGGHDVLRLYTEAVIKMNANPGVPQLFQDIFKNAYLPYHDPETLRGFLKIIDDFQYDHSERLGDAFEYLLSVFGSQGNAGQFRTPRHIIDFMVDIIAPQKNEVILDPACGTAGFLISAWKHIQGANAKDGIPGAALTPDQRRKLARNIFGYDISPDMVRLSLVNMYLHGFAEPHIHEYDTLTSDDKWNETADVILANPPFMSPTGGIRPHGRFSIQARRSEVLFVDYIAEHLSAKGRAAVIVPEGIIFQSAGAYKNLRKMLVENYIVAVVSLPAGVFNPYSGVKTSILFMDKSLAKKARDILFVKVENDGYDLGAQRRRIDKNDLPEAARQIKAHFDAAKTDAVRDMENTAGALVVARDKVNESADWNLNGELYREVEDIRQSDWPVVALGEVCDVIAGQSPEGKYYNNKSDGLPFYQGKSEFTEKFLGEPKKWTTKVTKKAQAGDIVMSVRAPVGPVNLVGQEICIGRGLAAIRAQKKIDGSFLFYILKEMESKITGNVGAAFASINRKDVQKLKIPLPPLNVQREILAEINAYQKIINGARQVVENYTPRISINPTWPVAKLGEVCEILDSLRKPVKKSDRKPGPYPYYGATGILDHVDQYIFDEKLVLIGEDGAKWETNEKTAFIAEGKYWVNNHAHVVRPNRSNALDEFLVAVIAQMDLRAYVTGVTVPKLNQQKLKQIRIPLPPLETQQKITAEIKAEEKLIAANQTLIRTFEQKIKTKIAAVWGEQ